MTYLDKDQVLAALNVLEDDADHEFGLYSFDNSWHVALMGARERIAALPAIPLDDQPIEIVQQQAEEDFVEWYERTTKPAPMWAEQAREWAHWLGGEDGGDLAELIGVHFFGELPRALPVLETPSNDLISRQAVEQWAIADFNEELLGFLKTLSPVEPVPATELFATKDEVDEWMNRARDEGYWEGWSDGQDVLKGDLMVTLDRIQGECDSEEWQTKCLHKCVEMLAHYDHDDIPPDGPCLVWSPICRECGAEVPAGAE